MSERTYRYAECNGCFREERMKTAGAFGGESLPDGWVTVSLHDGGTLWHLCPGCHKEVAVYLFDKARVDRVIGDRRSEAS